MSLRLWPLRYQCVGCDNYYWRVRYQNVIRRFCHERCRASWLRGYELGMRVAADYKAGIRVRGR